MHAKNHLNANKNFNIIIIKNNQKTRIKYSHILTQIRFSRAVKFMLNQ